jgi:excisionase family DNA binding protein
MKPNIENPTLNKHIRRAVMDEFEKLYTVEDIAKMTSFTSRTIRNYLKDGSLQGNKIGGQWRFTMENIRGLFDNSNFSKDLSGKNKQQTLDFIYGSKSDARGQIQVCTIVDCYCDSPAAGHQIYQKLVAVINSKEKDTSPARFNYDFIKKENKARFTLFGDPEYINKTLQLLPQNKESRN